MIIILLPTRHIPCELIITTQNNRGCMEYLTEKKTNYERIECMKYNDKHA